MITHANFANNWLRGFGVVGRVKFWPSLQTWLWTLEHDCTSMLVYVMDKLQFLIFMWISVINNSSLHDREKWWVLPRLARTWSRSISVSRIFCCCWASFSSYCIFIMRFSRSLRFNWATMFAIDAMSVVRFARLLPPDNTSFKDSRSSEMVLRK